jgi:hypothetical protein
MILRALASLMPDEVKTNKRRAKENMYKMFLTFPSLEGLS